VGLNAPPEGGSEFWFEARFALVRTLAGSATAAKPPLKGLRILVASPSNIVRAAASRQIIASGGKVTAVSTLPTTAKGYDAVLLTIRIARDWRIGAPFPEDRLRDKDGFAGIDGALPTVVYLVAQLDGVRGEVVGHAVVSTAGDIAELQRIAVHAAHRRSGVASALLAEVVKVAGRAEADRLLLEVREDNHAALGFYAGSGFTEIDRRPRYYADGATAVVLRLAGIRGTGTMAR